MAEAKNITTEKRDPVCGMDVSVYADILTARHDGKVMYFCGDRCRKRFSQNPARFHGTPLIALRGVKKTFRMGEVDVHVLRGLNLYIWEGDFVVIIGASGSGKSTTLNMIGLLDRPTSGKVLLKGRDVSLLHDNKRAELRSQTFGFVFQQYNLIPWLTAYENVAMPLLFAGNHDADEAIERRFQDIGLEDRSTHHPFELSGGEQQRVALIRALANNPAIILGDEPTGNLDSKTGEKILELLIDLNKKQKKTLVIITHDAGIAERADQIIAIKDGHLVRNHEAHKKVYTD